MSVQVVGIAWYRREDYDRLMSMFSDAGDLPATFDKWRAKADKAHRVLTRQGLIVAKALVDPETFPDWCRARGMEMDKHARMKYGMEWASKVRLEPVPRKRARARRPARKR